MDFKSVEKKWQKIWEDEKRFAAVDFDETRKKFYVLVEFPYPSGSGLHVGHTSGQTAMDVVARKKRLQNFNVLFPIGWDSFGLPAENYAIKTGIAPSITTTQNIAFFKKQIKSLGISFDWDREFATTDESFYKWTQWLFLQFFKNGLAYKSEANINWCPNCKVGLSNEESEGGVCERCGCQTVQKKKNQWMLKMKEYSEQLLQGLDKTNYLEHIKTSQRNWIGKSVGTNLTCSLNTGDKFEIFTTCIETVFGITYFVFAPDAPIVEKLKDQIENWAEVEEYIEKSSKKSEFERAELVKEKTGVILKGITAINPLNNSVVPVYISDYVLAGYGSGAVMAVPTHDQRDYEFAKKFDLPMIEVIAGGDTSIAAFEKADYLNKGSLLVNSGSFTGLTVEQAKVELNKYIEENKLGSKTTNYKMRDWVFSRQRYWGEPVPLVYCEKCGWVAVPDSELPVRLPVVDKYEPTDDGESPLSKIESWIKTTCPHCHGEARRETDVMPNWAGSSWYWLRYMDAKNDNAFADYEKIKYWGQVDLYSGGGEHVNRHLLYARFWHNFFYNIGLVPFSEPFNTRVQHGIVLGADGTKMSKSVGNVVDPMQVVNVYGADVLRLGQLFMGDYTATKPWSETSMKPCQKLLIRIENMLEKLVDGDVRAENKYMFATSIKKVDEDIETLKFNTAISQIMILVNHLEPQEKITKEEYKQLLTMLCVFAPHTAEELYTLAKLSDSMKNAMWPTYDEKDLVLDEIEYMVQINSKNCSKIFCSKDASNDEMTEIAKKESKIEIALQGKTIVKVIVIKGRLINLIVK